MRRWRFTSAILSVAVVLAGAMGAAGSARAQSDEELKALNEQVVALYNAGKYTEAIPLAERYAEAIKSRHGEDHRNTP